MLCISAIYNLLRSIKMTDLDLITYADLDLHDIASETTDSCYMFPCKHLRDDECEYQQGTEEYKKARKRRQNRESAVRIRARKKIEEGQAISTLDLLKESTEKLQIENSKLERENEILRKQISQLKMLSQQRGNKGEGEVKKVENGEEKKVIENGEEKNLAEGEKNKGKGKRMAGFGLTISLLSLISVICMGEEQPVNTGTRSLVFADNMVGMRPILLTFLVVTSFFLLHILVSR
jgi:hypothetical protein